jgi:hypothetical protein
MAFVSFVFSACEQALWVTLFNDIFFPPFMAVDVGSSRIPLDENRSATSERHDLKKRSRAESGVGTERPHRQKI